jgi:hypothetical protein
MMPEVQWRSKPARILLSSPLVWTLFEPPDPNQKSQTLALVINKVPQKNNFKKCLH